MNLRPSKKWPGWPFSVKAADDDKKQENQGGSRYGVYSVLLGDAGS